MEDYRTEQDAMGTIQVPKNAYWGAQTQRSLLNFQIGIERMPVHLIQSLVLVKKAAAIANEKSGKLDCEKSLRIQSAANEILTGKYDTQFPLSVWQTGSGTQTNMNVNEVIASIANQKDDTVPLHPNDDINMSQSTNDVFPTGIHIAGVKLLVEELFPSLENLIVTLKNLEKKNQGLIKIGRTHLQDATPILFSQEISGWRSMLEHNHQMLFNSLDFLYELPIGGTAVGTGLNASKIYRKEVIESIQQLTGLAFTSNPNLFHGLASKDAIVFTHGGLKALAANLLKIVNDIRWMASGPRSGLGEISIPSNEPGSSIMPGKVNPTQCEAVSMVVTQVMGNDASIGFAASQGNFELNVYMPSIAYQFLQSLQLLSDSIRSIDKNCIAGIQVNTDKMQQFLDQSLMLVTALNPYIGYDAASAIAKKAFSENTTLETAAVQSGYVTKEEFKKWVKPEKMLGE